MDLAYQLTWLEKPPSGMYANRASSGLMRPRPFAPLASQRWMAVVLGISRRWKLSRPAGETTLHHALRVLGPISLQRLIHQLVPNGLLEN